jgi:hypothetical protein
MVVLAGQGCESDSFPMSLSRIGVKFRFSRDIGRGSNIKTG